MEIKFITFGEQKLSFKWHSFATIVGKKEFTAKKVLDPKEVSDPKEDPKEVQIQIFESEGGLGSSYCI